MDFENEFLVDAPLDRTWSTLLDIQRVAQCLPGAVLESDGADGVYRGTMKVKLGPLSLQYKGTARMAEVEEDSHRATIEVQAKEFKGQGTASARIHNQLTSVPDGGTRVTVQTSLSITGRPAQFGRGIMEDVAGKMLEDFAKRLEVEVLATNGAGRAERADTGDAAVAEGLDGPAGSEERARTSAQPEPEAALDLGSVLFGPIATRAAIGLGAIALLALVWLAVRGRKPGPGLTISWR